ncbi:MAG: hypothetical protein ACREQQ_07285 [Candidatus Binatia bacterium]
MPINDHHTVAERRTTARRALRVPLRLTTRGRLPQQIDGETTDVSSLGLGVKFPSSRNQARLDTLLESLVEDRLVIEVMLRLPEGSVGCEARVVWWGLLGDEDKFGIRAGVLLAQPWSDMDWELIEKNVLRG